MALQKEVIIQKGDVAPIEGILSPFETYIGYQKCELGCQAMIEKARSEKAVEESQVYIDSKTLKSFGVGVIIGFALKWGIESLSKK